MSEASSEGEWTPAGSSSDPESEQQEALPLSSSLGASGGSTPRTPADAAAQVRLPTLGMLLLMHAQVPCKI